MGKSKIPSPRCSMYGIFTYIYHKNQPNVGKYTIHGAYGSWISVIYICEPYFLWFKVQGDHQNIVSHFHQGYQHPNIRTTWGVSKMDGENKGKPYWNGWFGGAHPYFWKHPLIATIAECQSPWRIKWFEQPKQVILPTPNTHNALPTNCP